MSKPKYGIALSRTEVAKLANEARWGNQSNLLAAAISEKVCESCKGPITFKRKPTWQQLRKRSRCYDCHSRFMAALRTSERFDSTPDGRGYIKIWRDNKKVTEHKAIAEEVLGRELKSNEMVHHINGDRSDNRKSNLLICEKGYHSELHWRMRHLYKEEHPEFNGSIMGADRLYMKEHFTSV